LTSPAKILGVDDEADFEPLIRQQFRRQIRDGEHRREIHGRCDLRRLRGAAREQRRSGNALACADMMLEALDRWNSERTRDGEARLAIGIGLNYGPAVLGDFGSEHSMSFTVIGDTVNTASDCNL
jgi:hypothetical protein